MQFHFHTQRATQAAALLVARAGGSLNYTKLIKLLYLADRKSLVDTGAPITGDRFVNMKNGPVLSAVYNYVKGATENPAWENVFGRDGYELRLKGDAGRDDLSDFAIKVLKRVYDDHEEYTYVQMINIVHDLPEWVAPSGPSLANDLDYVAVLRGAGVSDTALAEYEGLNEGTELLAEIARR